MDEAPPVMVAVKEEPQSPATEDNNLDDIVEDEHESSAFIPFEQVFIKEEGHNFSNTTLELAVKQESESSDVTTRGNIVCNIKSRFLKILGRESGTHLLFDAAPHIMSEDGSQQLIDDPGFITSDSSSSPCRGKKLDARREDPGPIVVTERGMENQKEDNDNFAVDEKTPRHECYTCGMQFPMLCTLNSHMRIHSNEIPFVCPVCSKEFSKKCNLNTHMRIHSGDQLFVCSVCNKEFNYKCNLVTHFRIHSGEKPYECSICRRKFGDQSTLIRHNRTHSGSRPYWCTVCQRRFSQSSSLVSHMRIHSGEKPYKCMVCFRKFTQKGILNTHMRTHSLECT